MTHVVVYVCLMLSSVAFASLLVRARIGGKVVEVSDKKRNVTNRDGYDSNSHFRQICRIVSNSCHNAASIAPYICSHPLDVHGTR